jgi:hypothetical protein
MVGEAFQRMTDQESGCWCRTTSVGTVPLSLRRSSAGVCELAQNCYTAIYGERSGQRGFQADDGPNAEAGGHAILGTTLGWLEANT